MSPPVVGLLILGILIAIWFLEWVPPLGATLLIRIRKGTVEVTRGHLRQSARTDLTEMLRDAGVTHGYIAITGDHRFTFSRSIPDDIRQKLRNIVVNP